MTESEFAALSINSHKMHPKNSAVDEIKLHKKQVKIAKLAIVALD
jgi:hypothetical protein